MKPTFMVSLAEPIAPTQDAHATLDGVTVGVWAATTYIALSEVGTYIKKQSY